MKLITKFLIFLLVPAVSYYSVWSKKNLKIFNVAGSSSSQNIFNSLLDGEVDYSVAIASTGSAIGLEHLETGKTDFALVSYDIKDWLSESSRSSKYKSLTLAEENIVVAYKPNSSCTTELEINSNNVKDFFSLFFGHKHDNSNIKTNLKDLMTNGSEACNTKLVPIVKSSGPTKSGTVKSLFTISLLSGSDSEWLNKIKKDYGSFSNPVFIQESGLVHSDYFLSNVNDGWITYLPSSFVINNWDSLKNKGVKFAKLKYDQSSVEFKKCNWENNIDVYKWKRPFNLVYSISSINEDFKSFINKIVENVGKLKNLQLKNMTIDKSNLFTTSSQ